MRLSKDIRNDGGAFSYTGLVFPDQGTDITGEKLDVENFTGAVNQGMIDNIIYYQYAYQSSSDTSTSEQKRNRAIGSSVGSNMKRNAGGTYAKDAQ